MKKLLLFTSVILFTFSLHASHFLGGTITWKCLSNGQYQFYMEMYRDCAGVPWTFQNETILIKGARKFQFEKIAYRLEHKIHQTTLEVRLNAFVNNLNVYRNILNPDTKIMVMVKAAAYGHGANEIAKLLEFHRVDYLGVAYADEGIALRKAGIKLPIMVLNPEKRRGIRLIDKKDMLVFLGVRLAQLT